MAQWRPLHRRITQSEKILALGSNDTARWIYCALLPYTDREGRINANPMGLAGTILEGFPYTPEVIQAALEALADVGLITLYQTSRHQLLAQFTNFELSKPHAKEPQSELPGPDDSGTEPVAFVGTPSGKQEAPSPDVSRKVPGNGLAKPAEVVPETTGTVTDPDVHVHVHVQREKEKLSSDSATEHTQPEPPAAEPRSHLELDDLIRIWNRERGQLVQCRSNKDPQLRRLGKAFLERHKKTPDGGEELFRAGITSVRSDPHWLGRRAPKVTRDGDPYGIVNYLRHAESKADAALDAEDNPRPTNPLLAQYEHLRGGTGGGS